MKIKVLALICLIIGGCGPYTLEVEPNPIIIEHKINLSDLKKYFRTICLDELTNPSEQELNNCIEDKVAAFLNTIAS